MENNSDDEYGKRYPKKIIASFQLGNLINLMMSQLYSQQFSFYYLGVIRMDVTLFLVANLLYTLFNMFNDPLLGHLCDKSKRFTKKWGKRFPFIIIGGIPYCFMAFFLFISPSISQIGHFGVFLWLLFFLCLSDMVFSLYDINRVALFPDKFRDSDDRKIGGSITAVLETIGVLLGVLIPVLIIDAYNNEFGWALQAFIISTIAFVVFIFMIPGVKEDDELRERRSKLDKEAHTPFFGGMWNALGDRNLLGYIAFYVCYTSAMGVVMASLPFFVQDILLMPKIGEIILIFYVVFVIISAPIWYKLSKKIGIKKVAMIGALLLGTMGLPLLFVPVGPSGLTLMIFILIIAGFVDGAIISMTMPIFSSIIDKEAIESGKRQEGLYNGTYLFFSRIGIAIRAFVIWIVVLFSGYQAGSTDPAELMGLRIQIAVFPLIIIFSGLIIFWRLYTITPEQLEENAKKLKEMRI